MTEVRLDPADIARMVSMRQQIEKQVTAEYDATPTWLLYPSWAMKDGVSGDEVREASRFADIAQETRRRFRAWCVREGL